MKKSLFLIVAAVMMLAANSCKKENVNEPNEPEVNREPQANEFCADIANGGTIQGAPSVNGDDMTTKAKFEGLIVKWQSNDVIYVKGTDKTSDQLESDWTPFTCKVTSGETTSRAYFENKSASPFQRKTYYAYYGTSLTLGTGSAGSLNATQVWNPNNTAENIPMYATSTDHWLTFKNICGVLKLTVPAIVTSADQIVVTANNDINGTFTIDGTPKMVINNASSTAANKTTTLTGTFAAGNVVYVAIPAGKYTFNIQFKKSGVTLYETGESTKELTVANNKIYNVTIPTPFPSSDCFCFTAREASTICMQGIGISTNYPCKLDYMKVEANGTVTTDHFLNGQTGSFTTTAVNLAQGDKLYIWGIDNETATNKVNRFAHSTYNYHKFVVTGSVDVSGKILYLIHKDLNKADAAYSALTNSYWYVFSGLFRTTTGLVNAKDLELPTSTPTAWAFAYTFDGATDLVSGPKLNAATTNTNCYYYMFQNCSSLKTLTMLATNITDAGHFTGWLLNAGNTTGGIKSVLTISSGLTGTSLSNLNSKINFDNWQIQTQTQQP